MNYSELLQLAKGWGNFISDRIIIWRLQYIYVIDKTYLFKTCIRFLKGKLKKIQELFIKRKVPVRAGRKFERILRRQHADTLQYR